MSRLAGDNGDDNDGGGDGSGPVLTGFRPKSKT